MLRYRTPRGHHRSGPGQPARDRRRTPFWTSLAEGRGAVRQIQAFPVEGLPNDVGGEVPDFDAQDACALPEASRSRSRKSLKYMARDIQLAVAAAQLAFADAGLADGGVDPTRIGVDLGAGLISTELDELAPAIDARLAADGHVRLPRLGPRGDRR